MAKSLALEQFFDTKQYDKNVRFLKKTAWIPVGWRWRCL